MRLVVRRGKAAGAGIASFDDVGALGSLSNVTYIIQVLLGVGAGLCRCKRFASGVERVRMADGRVLFPLRLAG